MHGCTADGRASVASRHYAALTQLTASKVGRRAPWPCTAVLHGDQEGVRVEHGDTSSDRTLANGSCSMGVGTRSTGSHLRVTRYLSRSMMVMRPMSVKHYLRPTRPSTTVPMTDTGPQVEYTTAQAKPYEGTRQHALVCPTRRVASVSHQSPPPPPH